MYARTERKYQNMYSNIKKSKKNKQWFIERKEIWTKKDSNLIS